MLKGETKRRDGVWQGIELADSEDGHPVRFQQSDGALWISLKDQDGIWWNNGTFTKAQIRQLSDFLHDRLITWEDEQ
jgi:hypothetical protein